MKKNLLIAVLCLVALSLKAQDERLGVMVGASSETVSINQVPNTLIDYVKGEGIVGFEFGMYGRFRIVEPIYIKPELLMLYANGSVLVQYTNNKNTDGKFNYFKTQVPVLAMVHLVGPLSLEGGPVYNYNLSTDISYSGKTIDVQPSGFGYRVGGEFKLGEHALFDLCFQGQSNSSSVSEAAFKVPYCILGDFGILFGESHP